jgi:hypothetical protein
MCMSRHRADMQEGGNATIGSAGCMTCAHPRFRGCRQPSKFRVQHTTAWQKVVFTIMVKVAHSAIAYIYLSISTKGARGVLAQLYVHRENKQDYFVMTYPKHLRTPPCLNLLFVRVSRDSFK